MTDLDEARADLCNGARHIYPQVSPESLRTVLEHLSQIETRAQQIRGGLKPYARPVEIVDYLMGEQA